MAKQKKVPLCVEADGRRRYISVSAVRALDLHNYLRSHGVRSAPPEPAFTGFDSIVFRCAKPVVRCCGSRPCPVPSVITRIAIVFRGFAHI
jgi:hypothetical protein